MSAGTTKPHRIAVAPGRGLAFEIEGEGAPLLALHGFTGRGATLADTTRRLGPGFEALRVDFAGHGASDPGQGPADYRLERCVADLVAVLDAWGRSSVHVLGYSMGGRVALGLATRHPERVRSLVLIGARAGFDDPDERASRVRADDALAARIEACGIEWFVEHWMALPLFASQRRLGAAALAAARQQRLLNQPRALADSLRGLGAGAQPPLSSRLSRVRGPVLLAVGDEDARFRAVAEDLAPRFRDARLALIPAAGHAAHLENPTQFADRIRPFLRNAERAHRTSGTKPESRPRQAQPGRHAPTDPLRRPP